MEPPVPEPSHDEARRSLGARLRQLRLARNYSQQAVAQDLSLAHSTVSSYERGSRPITIDRLLDFAAYYGLSLAELLDTADPPPCLR